MSSRDNWERLVAAVVKREQIWQLCHQNSISTISSDDSSGRFLSFSSNNSELIRDRYPQTDPSVSQVGNNASSTPITRMLFSAWYRIRKYRNEDSVHIPKDVAVHLGGLQRFSLYELQAATKDFSNENILPDTRDVYRGWLADGSRVAVKSYRKGKIGYHYAEDRFQRGLEINSIAKHTNVLHILGFCYTPNHWLLVFPFMVNGSVAKCLRDRHESQPPLNWAMRKGIALGVAKVLVHLHEECDKKILHRDIKAANILLNDDFEAVVADLDLGIVVAHDVTDVEEDNVCGTMGHIAPEYYSTFKCSEMSDVYGYGMLLLELITGQRASDLLCQPYVGTPPLLDRGKYEEIEWENLVDAYGGNFMENLVEQLIQIALICTSYSPEDRCKMSEVVRMLENEDGLAEKWEEWNKKQEKREEGNKIKEEDREWKVVDDDVVPDELSGPR